MSTFIQKVFCEKIVADLKGLIELIAKVDKSEAKALFANDKNDWRDHNALRKILLQEAKTISKRYEFGDLWDEQFKPNDMMDEPPLHSNEKF